MLAYPARAPADLRRIAILGGCVILHLGVLAVLGLTAIEQENPAPSDQPLFVIELTPRLLLQGPDSRPPRRPRARWKAAPAAAAATASAPLLPASPAPIPPVPRAPAAPVHPPGALALPGAAPLPASPGDVAIAQALRNGALGCRLGRSSPADQDRCDRATAEATARAAPLSGSGAPDRDARFAALGAEHESRYRALKPPTPASTRTLWDDARCLPWSSSESSERLTSDIPPSLRHGLPLQ